jgi:hypothetical protein
MVVSARRPPAEHPATVTVDTLVDVARSTMLASEAPARPSPEITDRVPRARGLVDGAIVDRYVVLSHLGSGSMGAVYAAWDRSTTGAWRSSPRTCRWAV